MSSMLGVFLLFGIVFMFCFLYVFCRSLLAVKIGSIIFRDSLEDWLPGYGEDEE